MHLKKSLQQQLQTTNSVQKYVISGTIKKWVAEVSQHAYLRPFPSHLLLFPASHTVNHLQRIL